MALQNIAHVGDDRDRPPLTLAGIDHLQAEKEAFFQSRGIDDTEQMLHVRISERRVEMPYGHPLLLRDGSQGVSPGKVHQIELR